MNEQQSRKIALKLLAATSSAEVNAAMRLDAAFAKENNWRPYGEASKNWDRIAAQTSDPVGALGELIINSIDAILMRKAAEKGINARGKDAPQSMPEAVKQFFPHVVEGKLASLSPEARTELAEKSVLIGVKRAAGAKKYPSYTIADFGEGQNPADFPKTLLSLGETNKEGIPFVQGRFNMGSTGSIVFCTSSDILKGHYKLVMSKRNLPDSDGNWGWTLIRVREAKSGEELPVAEYFCPDGRVPMFSDGELRAFGRDDIGVLNAGTIVKLYEYDIGPSARAVDLGLNNALTTNLLECALPVRIYDFNAKPLPDRSGLRRTGIAERTFSGMKVVFSGGDGVDESNIDLPTYQVAENTANPEIGMVRIYATGVKQLPEYLREYSYRSFYTLNGQTQAKEYAGFFRGAKLDDLRNHLIVQVDCNEMNATARSSIFKSDRERMSNNRFYRALRNFVRDALKDDRELRAYAREIRQRRVTEVIQDTERGRELWNALVGSNPELRELLGLGAVIADERQQGSGDEKFQGKQFPTILNLRTPSDGVLHLPVNRHRFVVCETDAANDYLGRELNRGKFYWKTEEIGLGRSVNLRNGKLRVGVFPPHDAQVGQSTKVILGLEDSSRAAPLSVEIEVRFSGEEDARSSSSGEERDSRTHTGPALRAPDIFWVYESGWKEYDFDEDSGAACRENDDGVRIPVNHDNKHLQSLLKKEREESARELLLHTFQLAVGVLTLSVHKRFAAKISDAENVDMDNYIKQASAAIAAHVVTLIQKLGGAKP